MIPNPILKVLSTLCTHDVRYLLMGGQACVLYGAAEFSRDCDIAIFCDTENLDRLRKSLEVLDAKCIAVPPFEVDYLLRGHVVHFRCNAPELQGVRLDVMAKMRGVEDFENLWKRRITLEGPIGETIDVLGLPDLILAKKTQRDKDWPMIRRLVEAHSAEHGQNPIEEHLRFWLLESRTPEMLAQLAQNHPAMVQVMMPQRPLLALALANDEPAIHRALLEEQESYRALDRKYWEPLRRELESIRQNRGRS